MAGAVVENGNVNVNGNSNGVSTEVLGESTWWESEGAVPVDRDNSVINRNWFPSDFLFGTGTAAYQVEGAAMKGGRGISVWDDFTLNQPWRIADGSNGTVACEMYYRYKEDIKKMKQMGFTSYRFSISWPRILPAGRVAGGVNQEGIDFYNDVINTLLEHDITPFVTLFHWDLPASLDKEYGGFLSKKIRQDFIEYAEVCFWEFGDRVKHWTTLNEPYMYASQGYVTGAMPPGRKLATSSTSVVTNLAATKAGAPPLTTTRSGTDKFPNPPVAHPSEVYTVARNLLLSHAEAVKLYRTKFQKVQGGKIGIVLVTNWFVPFDESSKEDKLAVDRALDFMLGWFLEPILTGHYPENMVDNVPPENLPSFNKAERDLLIGSLDFLGMNYYTAQYVLNDPNPTDEGYTSDQRVRFESYREGEPIGPPTGVEWLFSVPWGLYELLLYLNKYPTIKQLYITENGSCTATDFKKTAKMVCEDDGDRIKYHQDHIANLLKAMKKLTYELKGYSAWAWCDTYEWYSGYTIRFGLNYVDFANDYQRYPKNSAAWFAKFLHGETMPPEYFQPLWLQAKPESEKEKEKSSVSEEDLEIKLAKGAKLIVGYN